MHLLKVTKSNKTITLLIFCVLEATDGGKKTEVFIRPGNTTITRNNKIGVLKNFGMNFVMTFKLFISKLDTDIEWANILHFTIGDDSTNYGDRIPGIWLSSGARFFVSSAINGYKDYNKHMDLDVAENEWYDFEISQLSTDDGKVIITKYVIYFSYPFIFQHVFSCKIDDTVYWTIENENPMNFEDVIMYIGDPWYPAAQSLVQGLTVKTIDCGESCFY